MVLIWYNIDFFTPTLFNNPSDNTRILKVPMGSPLFTLSFIEEILLGNV
jgi:hypothetical protein